MLHQRHAVRRVLDTSPQLGRVWVLIAMSSDLMAFPVHCLHSRVSDRYGVRVYSREVLFCGFM
jgi:hypothetical protein